MIPLVKFTPQLRTPVTSVRCRSVSQSLSPRNGGSVPFFWQEDHADEESDDEDWEARCQAGCVRTEEGVADEGVGGDRTKGEEGGE